MLLNKWVLFALGLATAIFGYMSTVNWNTLWPSGAGLIVILIGVALKVIAAIMPPPTQSTIVSTGGSLITHTGLALLGMMMLAGVLGLGLSGCQTAQQDAASVVAAVNGAAANLQKISGGSLSKACAIVGTANGYVQALAGVVPVGNVATAALVMGDVNALCASGGSLTTIVASLANDWTQLQALATVPKS